MALAAAVLLAGTAHALDLHVDQASGSDAGDGLTWATARATVSSALTSAAASPEPDVVSVAAGCYTERLTVPADTTLLGGFPPGGGARDPLANPTILDAQGLAGPTVHFPPGSDGTVLDGFVVRGGTSWTYLDNGGGVLVEDAAPTIRGNLIEGNHACRGAGIALVYTMARPAAFVTDNVLQDNVCGTRLRCEDGVPAYGGGVYVEAPRGVDVGLVLSGNRHLHNDGVGGIGFMASGRMENEVVLDSMGPGMYLDGDSVEVRNSLVSGCSFTGIRVECGGGYRLSNVTVTGNAGGLVTGGFGVADVVADNSILWQEVAAAAWNCVDPGAMAIDSSIVRGGYPGGTNILDVDPLFVSGPASDYYLSQLSAGQAVTSPAVDAGNTTALAAGLDQRTTATDQAPDAGVVDLGYHPPRILALTIRRGVVATSLAPYRTVTALPFTDDPGTLSDHSLPLLFYDVPEAGNDIGVTKDAVADAPRIDYQR